MDVTPLDRRILRLLAAGTPDAEIAVRLGLPISSLKRRIAMLQQEAGLSNRRDLDGWQPPPPPAPVTPPPRPTAIPSRAQWLLPGLACAAFVLLAVALRLPAEPPAAEADDPAAITISVRPLPPDYDPNLFMIPSSDYRYFIALENERRAQTTCAEVLHICLLLSEAGLAEMPGGP